MVARLRAVLRRKELKIPGISLALGKLVLNSSGREVHWNGEALTLTTCEFNILEALLRARELVATKDALSELVLGRRRQPYDRSVDVHVSNLRKKIAGICGEELEIETVRGIGYRIRQQG
jgi:two-component system OmpR family response regulator